MKGNLLGVVVLLTASFVVTPLFAEEESESSPEEGKQVSAIPAVSQENTLDMCRDQVDNDGDGHMDCSDQDCEIYAICVKAPSVEDEEVKEVLEEKVEPKWVPESGLMCRDNKDNNGDGLIDCHEMSCQRYRYCRRTMYEILEPPNKAPRLLINVGIGVAFPNFRWPTAETETGYGSVPFDPDTGGMLGVKIGYLPFKWLGVGANMMAAVTLANNRREFFDDGDSKDEYKYIGNKLWSHIGAFVRFQWPFKRFVPYLDIAAGYSYTKYHWSVYDPANSWDVVGDWDDGDNDYFFEEDDQDRVGVRYTNTFRSRHFTFALEPGFDVFLSKRRFALGFRAWLPAIASNDSSTDNVGLLISLTFTPMWRERPVLKKEFDVAMLR